MGSASGTPLAGLRRGAFPARDRWAAGLAAQSQAAARDPAVMLAVMQETGGAAGRGLKTVMA